MKNVVWFLWLGDILCVKVLYMDIFRKIGAVGGLGKDYYFWGNLLCRCRLWFAF